MKKKRTISPEIISQRKFELIKRDPLAIELDELARGKRKTNITYRELHKRFPHYDYIEIQEQGLTGILEKELQRKWNVDCYPTGKLDKNIPFSWLGVYPTHPSVIDAREYINDSLLPAIKELFPYEEKHFKKHGWIFLSGQGGYECASDEEPTLQGLRWKGTFYIPIPEECIPILIDPGGLHKKKKEAVKELLWDIVEKIIQKRRPHKLKKWQPIQRTGDRPELGFICSTKEEKFKEYLRWYDARYKDRISCRLIAHIENIRKTNPMKASETFEYCKKKKVKWGIPQRGEDKIENGVNLIYKAIHREEHTQKSEEPLIEDIEDFKCEKHGQDYHPSCPTCKAWEDKFNRLYPAI